MNHDQRPIVASLVATAGLVVLVAFSWQQSEGWKTPPAMQHTAEGRANCMMCHKAGTMEAVPDAPASHADYPNDLCLSCHAKDAEVQTTAPPHIPHALEGRSSCTLCHAPGKMEAVPDMPASHEGRVDKYCTACHSTAS